MEELEEDEEMSEEEEVIEVEKPVQKKKNIPAKQQKPVAVPVSEEPVEMVNLDKPIDQVMVTLSLIYFFFTKFKFTN